VEFDQTLIFSQLNDAWRGDQLTGLLLPVACKLRPIIDGYAILVSPGLHPGKGPCFKSAAIKSNLRMEEW